MNPYEALANAIIEQAATDHKNAVKFLKKHPRTEELEADVAAQRLEKKKRREERKKLNLPKEREKYSKEERLLENITSNERMVSETEKFFLSDWYSNLTSVDGAWLLDRIKKMEDDEHEG